MRKIFFTAFAVAAIIFMFTVTENLRVENSEPEKIFDTHEPSHEKILQKQPENWWETNILTATGHGTAPEAEEVTRRTKALAKRVAMMDAQRKLAEQIAGVHVTATKNLVKTQVEAVVKYFTVVSEDYDEFGNCTVVLSVPIFGVNSVAQFAFPRVDKKNFPPPIETVNASGNYTGLIIDCGNLELNPVLSPEIRDENQTIYAYDNLERQKVLERGVVGYVAKKSDEDLIFVKTSGGKNIFAQIGSKIFVAESNSRAGNNPLVIKVSALNDDGTCPVISTEDADKILAENQISHFLDDGAVVFKSNRIRGMRM
ncbi:MAG: hypothetical protein IJ685_10400 [Selenomonadaceae bacterium]|nr:hypothetical protein [Selenomonadaceae bacterium]